MLGPCFVLQYFVSFLVLQSSRWGRESYLLYFCCVLIVMSLLSLFDSSSQRQWMVGSIVCDCGIFWSYSLTFSEWIPLGQNIKVRKKANIRNRYNQAPHLTQDTNGKVTSSQFDITNESQEVIPF